MRVLCVLRASPVYTTEYVYKLQAGVEKHLPEARFACLSDTPIDGVEVIPLEHGWPGWWSKMELFRPDIAGDFLFFDLDTIITGDLSPLAKLDKDTFLRDFYRGGDGIGSGVMYLTEARRALVWEKWNKAPARWMARYRRGGDQAFLETLYQRPQTFQDVAPNQLVSFKVHCSEGLPSGARVVCYHGNPKPHETNWAHHGSERKRQKRRVHRARKVRSPVGA